MNCNPLHVKCKDGTGCIPVCLTYYNDRGWYSPLCLTCKYEESIFTPFYWRKTSNEQSLSFVRNLECEGFCIFSRCATTNPVTCLNSQYNCYCTGLLCCVINNQSNSDDTCVLPCIACTYNSIFDKKELYSPLCCIQKFGKYTKVLSWVGYYNDFPTYFNDTPPKQNMN